MKKIIFIGCCFLSSQVLANNIVLGVEGGRSNIDLDSQYYPTATSDSDQNGTSINLLAGYKFDSHLTLGLTYTRFYGDSAFGIGDRVHVQLAGPVIGYTFNIARHFRFTPVLGLDFWKLEAKPDSVFHDQSSRYFSGTDPYARLDFEIPFTDLVALNISYTYGNYEFGELEAARVGVKFEF